MACVQDTPVWSENLRSDLSPISHESEQQNSYDFAFGSDDMDVESDGGVSVDDVQLIMSLEPANASDALLEKQQYHQTLVTPLDSSTYQWRLPVAPIKHTATTLKQFQLPPIAHAYHKHCGLITRHWSCHPEECIPLELRNLTPYSLTLLCSIRRLASSTKNNFELAQALLQQSWQTRHPKREPLVSPGLVLVETSGTTGTYKRGRKVPPQGNNEDKIQENQLGLMLVDVDQAIRSVRKDQAHQRTAKKAELQTSQRFSRRQKKLARQLEQNANLQLSTAERVVKRRRNERAAKLAAGNMTTFQDELFDVDIGPSIHQQSRLEDSFTVPPNSPTSLVDRSTAFVPAGALREVRNRHNEQAGTTEQDEEVLYEPSKRDRHQDFMMSRFMNNIDFDSQKQMKRKRMKRFQRGGFSRGGHEKVAMPSEKLELDHLSSLQTMTPVTDAAELCQMGQLPLPQPDQTSFTLPVRSKKVAQV